MKRIVVAALLILVMVGSVGAETKKAIPTAENVFVSATIGANKIAKTYLFGVKGGFDLGQVMKIGFGFRSADLKWKFKAIASYGQNTGDLTNIIDYAAKGLVQYYPWWDAQKKWGIFMGFTGGHEWLDFSNDLSGSITALTSSYVFGLEHLFKSGSGVELSINAQNAKTFFDIGLDLSASVPLPL